MKQVISAKLTRRAKAYSSSCSQVIVSISIHFVVIHSFEAKNRQKITLNQYFRVQGHSRSSMLISLKSLSLVLVMISSMSVPICNRFHATRDNCCKMTIFRGVAVFDACLRRPP